MILPGISFSPAGGPFALIPPIEIMISAGELPEHHKDPADRMIIAAALDAGLQVVTADHNFPLYGVKTIV